MAGGGTISVPVYTVEIPLLGAIKAALYGKWEVSGEPLFWKSNFPALPDDGEIVLTGALGGDLNIYIFGGMSGGKGKVEASWTWINDQNPRSIKFKEWCVFLEGTVYVTWGGINKSWKKNWGPCAEKSNTRTLRISSRNSLILKNYQITDDDVPVYEDIEYTKISFTGTGNVYEGNAVLGNIASDLLNDGIASVAKSSNGNIVAIWTKDFPASQLGAKVYSADWKGDSWGNPVEITPDVDFNKDTAVVFDSDDSLMVAWSKASNDGLDYEQNSVEEILDATEKADIFYSRRVNGTWTAPQLLAELPGKDEAVSLASDSDGEITAIWLNNSENNVTLYASVWNGSNWSNPVSVAKSVLIDPPVITYNSGKPVAVWAGYR